MALRRFRFGVILSTILVGVLFLLSPLYSQKDKDEKKLNVLLITIDTLRADRLSCYSNQHVQTPSIDRLASRSTLFTRAFAHNPTTLPSHTNILLGTTPLYHGVHANTSFIVRDEFLTLAEVLKEKGYSTGAFIGGYPLEYRFGLGQGFDMYDDDFFIRDPQKIEKRKIQTRDLEQKAQEVPNVERRADVVLEKALIWLKTQSSPWFLWVHCFDPHDPYEPPEPFKTQFKEELYDGEVAFVDSMIGKFFEDVGWNGVLSQTLVIFTGDHGEALGEHGEWTHGFLAYNCTQWTPLFIAVPGNKPSRVDHLASHIDIFPTVCDILRIEKPSHLQGISLLPAMRGKKLPKRKIYFESLGPYYDKGWAPLRGYLDTKIKFIDSPIPEVYDLEKDFNEATNLAQQKDLRFFKTNLDQIIQAQLSEERAKAEKRADSQSLEKLRSLGYIASSPDSRKEKYGPEDDVKVLLPYHHKAIQAMDVYAQGNVKQGINLLKQIITERPDVDIAYTNLAKIYDWQGRLDDALEVLKIGFEVLPLNNEIFSVYTEFLLRAGSYDKLIELFETRDLPQMDHDPQVWNYLGLAYWNKNQREKSISALRMAASIDSRNPISYYNLGTIFFAAAVEENDQEALQKAYRNYERAIELDPHYASAFLGLGRVHLQSGVYDEAIRYFEKTLELRNDFGDAVYSLGVAYFKKGEKPKALSYFENYRQNYGHLLSSQELKALESLIRLCLPKSQ